MSGTLDRILAAVAKATPQAPCEDIVIVDALLRDGVAQQDTLRGLDEAVAGRLLGTARITRNGVTQDVYWPTGLKTHALSGVKPKEPLIVPHTEEKPDTLAQKLIKAIVLNGPIANAPHEGPGAASSRTVPLDAVVGRRR